MPQDNQLMKNNILITGGFGLVGKALIAKLIKKKNKIVVLEKLKYKKRNKFIYNKNLKFIYGSLNNKLLIEKILIQNNIKIIFHTGAITQVLEGLKKPYSTYNTNVMGTLKILECIRKINPSISLIYSSSDKAYGEIKKRNYLEDDALSSVYPYDLSKACSDLICQSYNKVYSYATVNQCTVSTTISS